MMVSTTNASRSQRCAALLAASLFLFVVAVVPVCALITACSMPCCKQAPTSCAEHCGIRSAPVPQALPDALAATGQTSLPALAAFGPANPSTVPPKASPHLSGFSREAHHATPGDAPLYLFNSIFLI